MAVRILIADDHKIIRDGLRSLLEKEPGMEVVAEAGDGLTAVKMAQEFSPDVVVMDVTMPDLNGIEATGQILSAIPRAKVIGLSMHSDKRFVARMLQVGASGYLLKDCAFEELTEAIVSVMADEYYLSPELR